MASFSGTSTAIFASFNTSSLEKLLPYSLPPGPNIFFALFLTAAALFSIVANCLTCYVVIQSRRLQSTTNYFIVALALVALVLSFGAAPFFVGNLIAQSWIFGDALCRMVGMILQVCLGADVFILLSISVDRYYSIVYPLSFKVTRLRARNIILVSWCIATILATPMIHFFTTSEIMTNLTEQRCHIQMESSILSTPIIIYFVPLMVAEFVIPMTITAYNYARIWSYIWKFSSQGPRLWQRTTNQVPRSKIKIIKILLVVNMVDLVTISSYYCAHIVFLANIIYPKKEFDHFLVFATLVFFSALAKPAIYLILNGNFRRGCREVLCWSKLRCYRQELYIVTNASTFAKRNHVAAVLSNTNTNSYLTLEPMLEVSATLTNNRLARPPTTEINRNAKQWPSIRLTTF